MPGRTIADHGHRQFLHIFVPVQAICCVPDDSKLPMVFPSRYEFDSALRMRLGLDYEAGSISRDSVSTDVNSLV